MRNNIDFENEIKNKKAPDELLKITSLLYLKEALRNQEYEQCASLINSAKKFGANKGDIRKALRSFAKGGVSRQSRSDVKLGGRLGFLKGE